MQVPASVYELSISLGMMHVLAAISRQIEWRSQADEHGFKILGFTLNPRP